MIILRKIKSTALFIATKSTYSAGISRVMSNQVDSINQKSILPILVEYSVYDQMDNIIFFNKPAFNLQENHRGLVIDTGSFIYRTYAKIS